jgi:hypothetical protein
MTRTLALLVTALATLCAPSALGQSVSFVVDSVLASVAVGQSLAMPQVREQFFTTFAPTTDTVPLQVIGNCGNFGGATTVYVTVTASPGVLGSTSSVLTGTPPPFTATTPGECRLRITRSNYQQDLVVDVYDPKTLTLQPYDANFPLVSVAKNDTSTIVAARAVDAGGFHAIGQHVRYDPDPRHCALLNGADAAYTALTDATGVAALPFAVPANAPDGTCTLTATLVENGKQSPIQAFVFDAALATFTPTPAAIEAYASDSTTFGVVIRDGHGNPLPMLGVEGREITYVGGPGLMDGYQFGGRTDALGQFRTTFIPTNAVPGRYEIGIHAAGREFRVPVVQSLRGQPPPAPPAAITQSVQDLWWGGSAQNGWGVSLIEHRDTIFAVIYAYDDATQNCRWFAIPGGTWDETHTRYTGLIYLPSGAPFQSYDASRFDVQAPLGTATLIFTDADHVTLDVEMRGNKVNAKFGRIALTRQAFGSGSSALTNLSDMWWGGIEQNGWGVSVVQQAGALFSVWYTYGDDGRPTWYFMPAGTWTSSSTYEGRMYIATNDSDWIGYYVPDLLKVTDVGAFRLRFNADGTAALEYTVGASHGTLSLVRQPF